MRVGTAWRGAAITDRWLQTNKGGHRGPPYSRSYVHRRRAVGSAGARRFGTVKGNEQLVLARTGTFGDGERDLADG